MADIGRAIVREPGTRSPASYQHRVYALAAAFATLFLGSLIGIGLVVWKGQHLVTLAQRSNVETLTLAFLLVFFGYLAVISYSGAGGALRIATFAFLAWIGDRDRVERKKHLALAEVQEDSPSAGLNVILEKETTPGEPFELAIEDDAGRLGRLEIRGAELRHHQERKNGSHSLDAFVVEQVMEILAERGIKCDIDVVQWGKVDDEATRAYVSLTMFAWRLERYLGAAELWPKYLLTDEDCAKLEKALRDVCPALRDEAFLPDWEYSASHKLPLVPEPLGLLSLGRDERRADPVASMGCAVVVVLLALAILAMFVILPPWVPGK